MVERRISSLDEAAEAAEAAEAVEVAEAAAGMGAAAVGMGAAAGAAGAAGASGSSGGAFESARDGVSETELNRTELNMSSSWSVLIVVGSSSVVSSVSIGVGATAIGGGGGTASAFAAESCGVERRFCWCAGSAAGIDCIALAERSVRATALR